MRSGGIEPCKLAKICGRSCAEVIVKGGHDQECSRERPRAQTWWR